MDKHSSSKQVLNPKVACGVECLNKHSSNKQVQVLRREVEESLRGFVRHNSSSKLVVRNRQLLLREGSWRSFVRCSNSSNRK